MSLGALDGCDGRPGESSAGRRPGTLLTGSLFYQRSPGRVRTFSALIWLAFIVFPLVDAVGKREPLVQHGLVIGGAALFVVAYVSLVMTWRRGRHDGVRTALFAVLVGVASALTLAQSSGWGFLFTYCTACAAFVAPDEAGFYAVAACSALAGVTSALAGAAGGTVVSFVASSFGIGLLMLVMGDLRLRNQQLSEARAELAQMAVAQERERFARDLHDLLGHSLSVITLKAELAGRMLTDRPDDAAREVAELEQVARAALGEVRDAVSGYRQPTLEGELAGARMALSAAGIEADVHQARVPLDPAVEAALAWAVREGATNVIRHSGARHCTLRITASLIDAGVEVTDDGRGPVATAADDGRAAAPAASDDGRGAAPAAADNGRRAASSPASLDRPDNGHGADNVDAGMSDPGEVKRVAMNAGEVDGVATNGLGEASGDATNRPGDAALNGRSDVNGAAVAARGEADRHAERASGGHGLAGLAERARLVNGTLEAGALAGGGYRLALTVPVPRA
jgi:two-component system sensor histidine kinase DesK